MRSSLAALAALTAALAACGRSSPPPAVSEEPSAAPALAAPEPSTTTVSSPLSGQATGYTNEMQAENLRRQAARLGIEKLGEPGAEEEEQARPPVTYEEGLERTREYTREFEAERHALDRDRVKSVALPGETPKVISSGEQGAPLAPDGPEDPGTK